VRGQIVCLGVDLPSDNEQFVGYLGKAFCQAAQLDCRHPQKEDRTVAPFHFMTLQRSGNRRVWNR
jgi:hypothetical protein